LEEPPALILLFLGTPNLFRGGASEESYTGDGIIIGAAATALALLLTVER